jgi:hypothetical protein
MVLRLQRQPMAGHHRGVCRLSGLATRRRDPAASPHHRHPGDEPDPKQIAVSGIDFVDENGS